MAFSTMPDYSAVLPGIKQNYGYNNQVQQGQYGQAQQSLQKPLDFSGLPALPTPDAANRNLVTDAVYGQQSRYLDPQYSQGFSDLTSNLANQGIMEGSDAYNRAMNNFNLQKTAAYGDARDRAIQEGGAEQSRLYNLDLSGRNQGINEILAQRNAPLQALQSLSGINAGNTSGLFGVANNLYQAGMGNENANAATSTNFNNGLFSLGAAALQNPAITNKVANYATGLFA